MLNRKKLLCFSIALAVSCFRAETAEGGSHQQGVRGHLRGLKETPVTTLTWSQYSEWGIEEPQLHCTSPGAQYNHIVGDTGFNISSGVAHAHPPLACTAKKIWPNGYGYMTFTSGLRADESVAANFSDGLEEDEVWPVSGSKTSAFPDTLYYNMNFKPSWSIFYSWMYAEDGNEYGILMNARVAYGPDGWWIGSKDCKAYEDEKNSGLLSFKCKYWAYEGGDEDRYEPERHLLLTTGLNANSLNYSVLH